MKAPRRACRCLRGASSNISAKYSYDAWGNPISITNGQGNDVSNDPYHIANINPYRYRGYRFDTETGLYYLQSRYYDPSLGRFISMDDTKILMLTQGEVLGANLFAYCNNNPVMYSDPSGYWAINISVNKAAPVIDLVLALVGIGFALFSPAKVLSWSRKIFSWAKKAFDSFVTKISYVLANTIDTILYNFLKKYNSAGKFRIGVAAGVISWFLSTLIDLSPGKIVATIFDSVDRDGKSGYIRF